MIEFERGHAYVVDRGETKLRYGQGMAAGLGVVIRHFRDAFTKKLTNASETSGVFTVQYPEERLKLPDAFRNFPILLYDDETGQEFCTSCFQCERICPPQVIHITQEKDPNTGKPVPAAAEFLIEYDACMSCGLCAEVCPFDAIKMDHEFELATDEHGGLTINKAGLDRPVSYYEQIAPSFWAEAKDNAYKKLQGTLKRRSGLIGIAPQVAEKLKARLPEPGVVDEGRRTKDESSTSSDDKAARLAAIRARNAAKQAEANGTSDAAPTDDKAARLAAIRARNAAKKTDANGVAETAPQVEAPSDDKAARLAAIRAANTAKKAAQAPQPADDKAARLAAIRAANTAKKAAQAPEVDRPEPAQAAPADDKAARLAAIRAANAAKKAVQTTQGDSHDHSLNGTKKS